MSGKMPQRNGLSGNPFLQTAFLPFHEKFEWANVVIGIISDIHLTDSPDVQREEINLRKALLAFRNYGINVLIAAGDIADAGAEGAYAAFNLIFNKVFYDPCTRPQKLLVMGNHDYWNGLPVDQAQKRFESCLGVQANSHLTVNGYSFIGISPEDGETNGTFTSKSTDWLAAELKKAAADAPDKPIFVAVHQPVTGTVFDNYGWSNPALDPVLKEYPQAFLFAGHTHFPLQDERTIHQKDYTSAATATLSYAGIGSNEPNTLPLRDADKVAQGLLLTVSDSFVRIRRLDFHNNTVIETDWKIPMPVSKSNFTYTNERALKATAPYFTEGSTISVYNINPYSCTITFPSAQHPDFVYSYKVQIIDASTNAVVQEAFAFSDFYLGIPNMSSIQTFHITALNPNTVYNVSVVAAESFGKQSTPLTGTFMIV